jgi:hypothetical protein
VPWTPPADPGIDPAASLTARQAIVAWPEVGPTVPLTRKRAPGI